MLVSEFFNKQSEKIHYLCTINIKTKEIMNANWILIIVIGVVGMLVQWKLKSVFAKYSKVISPGGLTGAQIAQKMLNDNGIYDVSVTCIKGQLTDHYDPTKKTVNLSEDVYRSNSVSAAAVAAHECGHAVQHKEGYAPLRLRSALVPAVSISSKLSMIVILIGLFLIQTFPALFWIGTHRSSCRPRPLPSSCPYTGSCCWPRS